MEPVVEEVDDTLETPNEKGRTIQFKTFYWNYEDTDPDGEGTPGLLIHIGGRTADDKSVHCVVEGFTPQVYLELPKRIKWNKAKCIAVFEYFKKTMKSKGPLHYWLVQKYMFYYRDKVNTICLTFPTHDAVKKFEGRTRNELFIEGIGNFHRGEFRVHQHNIDPIIKFTAAKNILLAGWVKATETIHPEDEGLSEEDRKFTTADIDLRCNWDDINPYTPENVYAAIVSASYQAFDIECYSANHNSKIPDPEDPRNKIFSISIVTGKFGNPNMKKYLLSLCNPKDIPGVIIHRFKTEKELLLSFRDHLAENNSDCIPTYNGMKFDWNYIIKRTELLGIYHKFAMFSRIIGRKADIGVGNWSSSAYGEQIFKYFNPMGRTNVDVLMEIERNYKFPKYSLDYVSEYFLKENKEDVTPRQLFILYQLTDVMSPIIESLENGEIDKDTRVELKTKIQSLMPRRHCTGKVLSIRKNLMSAKTGSQFKSFIRDPLTLTGSYNVQDSVLAVKLCEKLNLWTGMEETSNTMHVPMSYLHTRGQQIKVLAQVYRETTFDDIIIPAQTRIKEPEKYEGAVVIEANPGDYDNVVCLDFESLYPSEIIANNICHTTFLRPNDPTPDSECNVVRVISHVGCQHDPQHRKRKAKDVICKDVIHRFRKVVTLPDGTRLNEGVMPKLERKLLTTRKAVKKEMGKLEAKLKMVLGTATEEDIAFYKKVGWEIVEKDSLTKEQIDILKINIKVLNARQLGIKVSANSVYGGYGAQFGYIPLVPGAESITGKGREHIKDSIRYTLEKYKGVAKLVYGDTDSSMITFIGKNTEESFALGDKISKEISHYLKTKMINVTEEFSLINPRDKKSYRIDKYPRGEMEGLSDAHKILIHEYDANPINLQFENLYKRFLLFTKKRYVARATNRLGKITAVIKKGNVLVRREICLYIKNVYEKVVEAILDNEPENEVMYKLYDGIHLLFTRQVPDANLIKYTGIKTLMHYAKHQDVGSDPGSGGEKIYLDDDKMPIVDPIGPLDPRLVYPNLPHVLLALKMMRRGDDVPPNTRLEYIYIENPAADHQGEQAEDYTYYRENKSEIGPDGRPSKKGMKPDYLLYLDKLIKPVSEVLRVKYSKDVILFETIEDAFNRLVEGLSDLNRYRVKNTKEYSVSTTPWSNLPFRDSVSPIGTDSGVVVGWSAVCQDCAATTATAGGGSGRLCEKHKTYRKPIISMSNRYSFKNEQAKIRYILNSAEKRKLNPKTAINEIDPDKHKELITISNVWKSRYILDSLHRSYGIPKRKPKKPTQTGTKLPVITANVHNNAYFAKKFKAQFDKSGAIKSREYSRGEMITLQTVVELIDDITSTTKKKRYKYIYTATDSEGKLVENIPREYITSYRIKDSGVLTDIYNYRYYYKCVVESLDEKFSPIKWIGLDKKKSNIKTSAKGEIETLPLTIEEETDV